MQQIRKRRPKPRKFSRGERANLSLKPGQRDRLNLLKMKCSR